MSAPRTIGLAPVTTRKGRDECLFSFDPTALLAAAHLPDTCTAATVTGGRKAVLCADGPGGSGHFWTWTLAMAGKPVRWACGMASTAGWRHLALAPPRLGRLPWLADLDGDGVAEVVLWQRLPFGREPTEATQGLWPAVYEVAPDGTRLIAAPPRGQHLRHRVADAYRRLATKQHWGAPCYRAVAAALDQPAPRVWPKRTSTR